MNRPGADARRDRLLEDIPTRAGFDRDEYPPAVGRGRGKGLMRGSSPRGWKADVEYVESLENQSHGASLGGKLRRFCKRHPVPLRVLLVPPGTVAACDMRGELLNVPPDSCSNLTASPPAKAVRWV